MLLESRIWISSFAWCTTWLSSFIFSNNQCIIQLVMHVLFSRSCSVLSFDNKQHESISEYIVIWIIFEVVLAAIFHLLTIHKQKTACAYSWLHTGSAIQCLRWSVKWSARWKTHITPWKCYLRGNESINTLQCERTRQSIITPKKCWKCCFQKVWLFP